jgi:hypothetical protein
MAPRGKAIGEPGRPMHPILMTVQGTARFRLDDRTAAGLSP